MDKRSLSHIRLKNLSVSPGNPRKSGWGHGLLCLSVLCLLTACGSGTSTVEESSPESSTGEVPLTLQESPSETSPETVPEATATAPGAETPTTDPSLTAAAQPEIASTETVEAQPDASTAPSSAPEAQPDIAQVESGEAQADTIVVPGERVGPVTLATTRADLAEIYGENALADTEIPVGEGFTESGTTVNAGSDQAFAIIWTDATQTQPATVMDFGPAWQTPEGLKLGTSFAELKSTAGGFSLYGLGWDYEGTVILEGSNLAQYHNLLLLRLGPKPDAITQYPNEYQAVLGDKLLSSDDPNLPPLDLSVYEMIVYLTPLIQ
ncbi:MAG: hypothetical protein AAGE59_17960 [Cyanobacteria bacterium P01_F01_bin.86]